MTDPTFIDPEASAELSELVQSPALVLRFPTDPDSQVAISGRLPSTPDEVYPGGEILLVIEDSSADDAELPSAIFLTRLEAVHLSAALAGYARSLEVIDACTALGTSAAELLATAEQLAQELGADPDDVYEELENALLRGELTVVEEDPAAPEGVLYGLNPDTIVHGPAVETGEEG